MSPADLVLYEQDFRILQQILRRLRQESEASVVLLVDKNGQRIASIGDVDNLDVTSLASLTAGNIAATGGIAKLINEKEFSQIFHEGERDNLHISIVAGRVILVVIFDKRSSLGLVRLRVKKCSEELAQIFESLLQRSEKMGQQSPFAEITDEDIDNLFSV